MPSLINQKVEYHLAVTIPARNWAKNKLMEEAHELQNDLCISFNKALVLAKRMSNNLTSIAKWK